MNVGVGYFCDPEGLEGLAHFLGIYLLICYSDSRITICS